MIHAADTIAIRMARTLVDAGCDVRLYLSVKHMEWSIIASIGDKQVGFGYRVSSADLLTDPETFADYRARRMLEDLTR